MTKSLAADLGRVQTLAFAHVSDCRDLIQRWHALHHAAENHEDFHLLEKLYAWAFVPLSLWPADVRGLALRVLEFVESGRELDLQARLMARLLQEAPGQTVCDPIAEYEHAVKTGNYESLIAAQFKFDLMEKELAKNPELKADWAAIKQEFDVDRYRNAAGIIRRRLVQERNFRPADWKFAWDTEAQRFQNVFDAFCHKWDLWGVERRRTEKADGKREKAAVRSHRTEIRSGKAVEWEDRPCLLKLTANVTPYGTMIMVPRYWSFDPRRDLNWKAITRLHRMRSEHKQGTKHSPNVAERREEAKRARVLWQEATASGMKGEKRKRWVMQRLGWDARTDESRLRRLIKGG